MSDGDNVVAFPSKLHETQVSQIHCLECGSRAWRLVGEGTGQDGWEVECHNCGSPQEDMVVIWDQHGIF